jgi:hypothetical protein
MTWSQKMLPAKKNLCAGVGQIDLDNFLTLLRLVRMQILVILS